jgi:hypothetical protein
MASIVSMIDERLMGNYLTGSGRGLFKLLSLRIYVVGLSKARKYVSHSMGCLYRDSKQGTPKYGSGILPLAHLSRVTNEDFERDSNT